MARSLCVLTAILAVVLTAPASLADAAFPELDVYTYDQTPGATTDLYLELVMLAAQPNATTAAITVPSGYGVTLAPVGTRLGEAEVDVVPAAGGAVTKLKGSAVVSDPAAFAADPQTQTCAPGTHAATWGLSLGTATVPIAVDALSSGGSYRLTLCLDSLRVANLKPVDIYFALEQVFRNPGTPQVYWWSALVTPVDESGAPAPSSAFEVQGGEPIPEPLSIRASWDAKKHVFTARGVLAGGGAPRTGIHVHLYAGGTPIPGAMREIGFATTSSAGSYLFRQRRTRKPAYLYAHVNFYHGSSCTQPSTAPLGCAGWSIDGTDSSVVKTR